jgi:hypothetical protein
VDKAIIFRKCIEAFLGCCSRRRIPQWLRIFAGSFTAHIEGAIPATVITMFKTKDRLAPMFDDIRFPR